MLASKPVNPVLLSAIIFAFGLHLGLLYAFHWPSGKRVQPDTAVDAVKIHFSLINPVVINNHAPGINGTDITETSFKESIAEKTQKIATQPKRKQTIQTKLSDNKSKAKKPETPSPPLPKDNEIVSAKKPHKTDMPAEKPVKNSAKNTLADTSEQIVATDQPFQQAQYIQQLLSQLEKNKFYPSKARRRQIEGAVVVTMAIKPSGEIHSLEISEGHDLLRKATVIAIERSLPLIKPPVTLAAPQTIQFSVDYRFQ